MFHRFYCPRREDLPRFSCAFSMPEGPVSNVLPAAPTPLADASLRAVAVGLDAGCLASCGGTMAAGVGMFGALEKHMSAPRVSVVRNWPADHMSPTGQY